MKQNILLVEDNLDIRENTTELLELFNYTVVAASDGKIGLNMAMLQTPDLICVIYKCPL